MTSKLIAPTNWPIWALLASAFMLASAHAFENFMFLAPCQLCLKQRDVYWAAIALSVVAIISMRLVRSPRLPFAMNSLLGLVFLCGMLIAGYHTGVEWGIFPAPEACTSTVTINDIPKNAASVNLDKAYAMPSCDAVAWSLFGISMAGYNTLISLGLAAVSFFAAFRTLSDAKRASV